MSEEERQIIESMTKFFVPIDTTDLKKVVPESERILCSLNCSGKLFATTPPIHVLITPRGIAYRLLGITNSFCHWYSRKNRIAVKKSHA